MKYRVFSRRRFLEMFLGVSAAACLPGCGSKTSDERFGSRPPDTPDANVDDRRPDTYKDGNTEGKDNANGIPDGGGRPALIWLQAQDCAGCTESLLSSLETDYPQLLFEDICLRYHETLMFGTGDTSNFSLEQAVAEGNYILVVEGAFPEGDPRFLRINGESLEGLFISAANNATVILAAGTCAAFGAIPKAGATGGRGVYDVLGAHNVKKPLVNIPGCPMHPIWFLDALKVVANGQTPALDDHFRPLEHFGQTVHDQCPRLDFNTKRRFLEDWNNPIQREWCLYNKGCKGQETYADCPKVLWNGKANWCIGSCSPCAGCTDPRFCSKERTFYSNNTS
jgi:hydrogenase small subunit